VNNTLVVYLGVPPQLLFKCVPVHCLFQSFQRYSPSPCARQHKLHTLLGLVHNLVNFDKYFFLRDTEDLDNNLYVFHHFCSIVI